MSRWWGLNVEGHPGALIMTMVPESHRLSTIYAYTWYMTGALELESPLFIEEGRLTRFDSIESLEYPSVDDDDSDASNSETDEEAFQAF